MANACFRCKASIESGETFCRRCREVASMEFPFTRDSRLWIVVLGAPTLGLLTILASVGYVAATGASGILVGAGVTVAWLLGLPWLWALHLDCKHVGRRDDTDWEPSEWLYLFVGACSVLLLVPMFLVGPYHCYRRRETIGLPR